MKKLYATFALLFLISVWPMSKAKADVITCVAPTPILKCTIDGTNCSEPLNADSLTCVGDGGFWNFPAYDYTAGLNGSCQAGYVPVYRDLCDLGGWGLDQAYPNCNNSYSINQWWTDYILYWATSEEATSLEGCYGGWTTPY